MMDELREHLMNMDMDKLMAESAISGISVEKNMTKEKTVEAIYKTLTDKDGLLKYLDHLDYRSSLLFHRIVEQEEYTLVGQDETDLMYMGCLCIERNGSHVHVVKEVKQVYPSAIQREAITYDREWLDACIYHCGVSYGVYSIETLTKYMRYVNREISEREVSILCDMRQDILHDDGYLVAIDLKGKDYHRLKNFAKTIEPYFVNKSTIDDIWNSGYAVNYPGYKKIVSYLKEHKIKPKDIKDRMKKIYEEICRNGWISLSDDVFRSDYEIALNIPTDRVQLYEIIDYTSFNAFQRDSYGHMFHEFPCVSTQMQKKMLEAIKVDNPKGMHDVYRKLSGWYSEKYIIPFMCQWAYDAYEDGTFDRKKAYALIKLEVDKRIYEEELRGIYGYLMTNDKNELLRIIREAGLEADEKMKKATLASRTVQEILRPDVMHKIFERYGSPAYELMEEICINGEARYSMYVSKVPSSFLALYVQRRNLRLLVRGIVKEAYLSMKEKYHVTYRRKTTYWE